MMTGSARAQSEPGTMSTDEAQQRFMAPRSALEIGVAAGYTQPVGELWRGRSIAGTVGPGFTAGASVGYRVAPRWSVEVVGQFHESNAEEGLPDGSHVRGMTAGVAATFHLRPYRMFDPYVQLGTGYRLLWEAPAGASATEFLHGFELARLQIGVEDRISKDIAIGPYLATDVNVFVRDRPASGADEAGIASTRASTFFSAGILARFDVGGTREPRVARATPIYFSANVPQPSPSAPPPPAEPSVVRVDPQILEACSVSEKKAFFEFDSSNVMSGDAATLDAVATCLTTGTLAGREVTIVGRADPRGTNAYNMKLGYARAEAVRAYLVGRGVKAGDVTPASRGEEDASAAPSQWPNDRRVDILLK